MSVIFMFAVEAPFDTLEPRQDREVQILALARVICAGILKSTRQEGGEP